MASPEASAASSIAPSGTTFPEAVFEDLSSPLLGWKKKVCFLQTLAASMPVNNTANTRPSVPPNCTSLFLHTMQDEFFDFQGGCKIFATCFAVEILFPVLSICLFFPESFFNRQIIYKTSGL